MCESCSAVDAIAMDGKTVERAILAQQLSGDADLENDIESAVKHLETKRFRKAAEGQGATRGKTKTKSTKSITRGKGEREITS